MQINYFKLSIFIIFLLIFQLLINNATILYLDCLTLLLVGLLLEGVFAVRVLIAICLVADLLGHWYLGTHLLAITLVSFLTKGLVNFYRVSNTLQKIVLNGIFSLIAYAIISLVALLTHSSNFSWLNLLIEVLVLNPIILLILNTFIIKLSSDIILNE